MFYHKRQRTVISRAGYIQWYDVQTGVSKNIGILLYRSITTEKRTGGRTDWRAQVCAVRKINRAPTDRIRDGKLYVWWETVMGCKSCTLPTLVYLAASTELININHFNVKTSRNVCFVISRCTNCSPALKQSKGSTWQLLFLNRLASTCTAYVVGSKSFQADIQKPRQMENALRDI